MKSAGKARSNGLYRHIRTSKEIIRNLLNDLDNIKNAPVIDDFEWKFFAVIVICSRIIAFSPSGKPGAIITRQFIDTAWTNWTSIK